MEEQNPLTSSVRRPAIGWIQIIAHLAAFGGFVIAGVGVSFILATIVVTLLPGLNGDVVLLACAAAAVAGASAAALRLFQEQTLAAVGIGIDRPWLRHLLLGVGVGGGAFSVCWAFWWIAGWAAVRVNPDLSSALPSIAGTMFLAAGVSVYEELLCRGYPLQLLARRNLVLGLVITAALFVSLHVANEGGGSGIVILNLVLGHLMFAAAYLRSRSLWLAIGLHAGWNVMQAVVLGVGQPSDGPASSLLVTDLKSSIWTASAFGPEGGLIVTVVLVATTLLLWRLLPQRHPQPDLLSR